MLGRVSKVYGADHEPQNLTGDFLYVHVACHLLYIHYQHSNKGDAVVGAFAQQQEGPGFEIALPGPKWVLSGYSGFLPQSKDIKKRRLTSYSKLSVGVIVSESDQIRPHLDPEKDKQF